MLLVPVIHLLIARPLDKSAFFFKFLIRNICCWYSKEPSQRDGSFEHQKHMFELMDKKIITFFLPNIFVYFILCKFAILLQMAHWRETIYL